MLSPGPYHDVYAKAAQRVADEARAVGFAWRPTVIVAAAAIALLLPEYHGDQNWFASLLRAIGSPAFAASCKRLCFDYAFVMQVGLPLLVIYALRERLRDFGLGLGDIKRGLRLCGIFYVLYIPCFIVLFANSGFQQYYAGVAQRYTSWPQFFFAEIVTIFFLMLRTEFLYRGFLLFGIKKDYGTYAGILVQLIPYVLVHASKAELEALGSLPVGLALAYLAARTGSIWYGAFLHASIALLFNALILFLHFHQ